MPRARLGLALAALAALLAVLAGPAAPAAAAPGGPSSPTPPGGAGGATVTIDIGDPHKPSQSIQIILLLTLLSVAPALLIMLTSFSRIVIVLGITRNALGLQAIPPNQVLVGLSLFLTLFVMAPTLSSINHDALQPLLHGKKSQADALKAAEGPLKQFMLKQTRKDELELLLKSSGQPRPKRREDVALTTLIPAFALSEIKTAMIIGFVVFIPFLIIDIVVSSSLMSMGMMMLPPSLISLPFKLLLFVMVDGWGLVVRSLLASFR
jgi:flagellar biosynthesis protein FliP